MREYDETTLKVAERVLKRSDEIVRQRKIKVKQRISFAASGICVASILCFCILNINQSLKFNNGDDDNNPAVTSDTTTENESTAIVTTEPLGDTSELVNVTVSDTSIVTEPVSDTLNTHISDTQEKETKAETEAAFDESKSSEETVNTKKPETQVASTEKAEIITAKAPVTTKAPVITEAPVTTEAPVITEAPVTTVTEALKPTLCGDVNLDGWIDIEDSSLVNSYVNKFKGTPWADFCRTNGIDNPDQALANADAYRASDRREITSEDAKAIMGYINGDYPNLPIDSL